jgi:tight adherence protein C
VYLLLLIGVALVAATAALIGRAVALPRIQARARLENLTVYGFVDEGEPVAGERALSGAVNGLARSLGGVAAGRVKGLSEPEMRRELMSAGMYRMSPVTLIGYRVISAVCFPATFLWLASAGNMAGLVSVAGTLLMLAVGWIGPMTVIRRRARRRLTQIDYEMPELVDLLVLTVEAGMGFAGAMQVAGERFSGPLGDEVRLAQQEQAMGLSADRALANMLERAETDAMRSFVRSIRQGEALGVSIGQIMRNLAVEMRERRRATAEERAQKAPIKILFPLVALIFPPIFVVLLAPAVLNFVVFMGGR